LGFEKAKSIYNLMILDSKTRKEVETETVVKYVMECSKQLRKHDYHFVWSMISRF